MAVYAKKIPIWVQKGILVHSYVLFNIWNVTQWDCVVRIVVVTCTFDVCTESVQQSLEKKFGKAGGTIPITPSDLFEKRMGVSTNTTTHLYLIHCQSVALLSVLFCPQL